MSLDLNTIWFILIGVLLGGYAVLDGFDLGVGALHLFTKTDTDRRITLNSIGPVWDGNEVWLVTGGGALFAAFPEVYATSFSGFYLAFMLLLFALIFRAVAIEFRSKRESRKWRTAWDMSFSVSSIVSALLIGVALGNIAFGIPLTAEHEYTGGLIGLLRPYPIVVGVTSVFLFTMHGAIYLVMKTEGDLQAQVRSWIPRLIAFFVIGYVFTTMLTLAFLPHMKDMLMDHPILFLIPLLNVLAIANIPREVYHGRDFRAFLSSCVAMLLLLALFGIGMYPNMIYSSPLPEYSLTIYNGSSSAKTQQIMLIIAAIGMPVVLAYTVSIYWIFRGKVKLDAASY
ncbi:MAG: cytochrome d ubiquinol oxidase subunit II [Gemmatimonadota bacterium]|nr:MAG: cytochrome d ubiquinol oxidase subunit II [Gemmatimonadota bacterium]